MKICLAAVQVDAAGNTYAQIRQQSDQADNPEIEICERHPDGLRPQVGHYGNGETEDSVTGFALRKKLVNYFCDITERQQARIADLIGQRRSQNLKGVESGQFLFFLVMPVGHHVRQRFQRAAKSFPGLLGRLGYALDLALRAGKQNYQQVRFMEGIGAKDKSFANNRTIGSSSHRINRSEEHTS